MNEERLIVKISKEGINVYNLNIITLGDICGDFDSM
jgi:hypothetical protein